MFGAMYKDFIVLKIHFRVIIPIISFVFLWMIALPLLTSGEKLEDWELGLVFVLSSIIIFFVLLMLGQAIIESDERKKWLFFISSAPDGIKTQVGSKYLINFLITTCVFNLLTVIGSLNSAIYDVDITIFQTLGFQFAWLQLLIYAIETPFVLAFGSKTGNYIRMLIIALFSLGFIIYGLFGDLSIFGSPVEFFMWLKNFLSDSSSYFLLLTPPAILCLYYISYRISCAVYLKGGDSFDK